MKAKAACRRVLMISSFADEPLCLNVPLSTLQSSPSGSAQQGPVKGGALSWMRPNLQDADVTICVRPTTAAATTLMSTA